MLKLVTCTSAILLALTLSAEATDQSVPNTGGTANTGVQANSQSTGGAGSMKMNDANSEDQGGAGIKGSAQGEGATNKDTTPR